MLAKEAQCSRGFKYLKSALCVFLAKNLAPLAVKKFIDDKLFFIKND